MHKDKATVQYIQYIRVYRCSLHNSFNFPVSLIIFNVESWGKINYICRTYLQIRMHKLAEKVSAVWKKILEARVEHS